MQRDGRREHSACSIACMMHRDCLLRRRRLHTRILVRAMRAAITTRRQGARNDPCFAMINVNCFIPQKGNSNQVSRLEWDKKSLRMQARSFACFFLSPDLPPRHQRFRTFGTPCSTCIRKMDGSGSIFSKPKPTRRGS